MNSAEIVTLYGSETSNTTNPFFLFDAPSRVITPTLPSSEILTSFTVRASTVTVSKMSVSWCCLLSVIIFNLFYTTEQSFDSIYCRHITLKDSVYTLRFILWAPIIFLWDIFELILSLK